MLDKEMDTKPAPDAYLDGFTKLGDQLFYFEPKKTPTSANHDVLPPELVILCSWLYALPKHIAKYTSAYQKLYSTTPILLLKQDGPDLMWRPNTWQLQNLQPAIDVVRALEARIGTSRRPRILMHVFSNGGSFTACQFCDAYALATKMVFQDSGMSLAISPLLPLSALVIDSAPSIPTISSGYVALSQGLPASLPAPVRLVGGVLIYGFMSTTSLIGKLFGVEGVISGMRRRLNDPKGAFMADHLRRVYIYSESDELVPWQHVEMHANEAREVFDKRGAGLGDAWVKLEKFAGSKHVGHVVVNAERYWQIVRTSWQTAVGEK